MSASRKTENQILGAARKTSSALVGWLAKPRIFLGGTVLEYVVVALIVLLITNFIMDGILFNGISRRIFTQGAGDATAGLIWGNTVNEVGSFFHTYTHMTNYPIGERLDNPWIITSLVFWVPVRVMSIIFSPITAANIMTAAGFIASFMSMYWLIKRLTKMKMVAFFAGYGVAFAPYVVGKGTAHLAYVFNVLFVFVIAAFIALYRRPSWKRALLLAITIGLCFYFDGYFIILAAVLVVGLCLAGVIVSRVFAENDTRRFLVRRLRYLLMSFGMLIVIISPIAIYTLRSGSETIQSLSTTRNPIASELPYYRSWPIDFIMPARDNAFLKDNSDFQAIQQYKNSRSDVLSNTNYIGFTVLVMCAFGLAIAIASLISLKNKRLSGRPTLHRMSPEERKTFLLVLTIAAVCGVAFLAFMFSPDIRDIKLPGYLLIKYDINLWRNLSRFAGPLQVTTVLFAAMSLWATIRYSKIFKNRLSVAAVVGAIVGLMACEFSNTINTPAYDVEAAKSSSVYAKLIEMKDVKVVAELPLVDPLDELQSYYTMLQLSHGKKLVNIKVPQDRPNATMLGSIENKETIDWIIERGAQVAIVHYMDKGCPDVSWGSLLYYAQSNSTCLYKINQSSAKDETYIRFESGVDPTPNYVEGSRNTFRLNSASVKMSVVDDRFDNVSEASCRVNLRAKLDNWNHDNPVGGKWRLVQSGKTLNEGDVAAGGVADLEAEASCADSINLELDRKNDGNDLLITETQVDELR